MSYLVHLSFELVPHSTEAMERATKVLNDLGFYGVITNQEKKTVTLPSGTFVGKFNGENAIKIRDDLGARVKSAFTSNQLEAGMFISVGGDWAWWHWQA